MPVNYELGAQSPSLEGRGLCGMELGRGKDAVAYELGPDLVYRMGHQLDLPDEAMYRDFFIDHTRREVAACADLPEDVAVSRTLMAWFQDNRIHKIVERAEGQPIHKTGEVGKLIPIAKVREDWERAIAVAASVPDEHFAKLVRDEAELRKRNIFMDYLGMENLLYDPETGFTIIDPEFEPTILLKGKSMYCALVDIHSLGVLILRNPSWQGNISPEARTHAIKVLQKLECAGHCPKYRLQFKILCEKLDYKPSFTALAPAA